MIRPLLLTLLLGLTAKAAHAQDVWTPSNHGIEFGYANQICTDSDGYVYVVNGYGLYVSSDDGESWQNSELETDWRDYALFVTRANTLIYTSFNNVDTALVSTDHGSTWTKVIGVEQIHYVIDDGERLFAASRRALFESTDDGISWSRVRDSLVHNAMDVHLLASVSSGGLIGSLNDTTLVRSDDRGKTWSVVCRRSEPISSIKRTPSGALLITQYDGVHRSDDDAVTWVHTLDAPVNGIVEGPFGVLYTSQYRYAKVRGAWKSIDDGRTWTSYRDDVRGPIAISTQGSIFNSNDDGLQRSRNANEWEPISTGYKGIGVFAMYADDNGDVIAGVGRPRGQIIRSVDDGRSWEILNRNVDGEPSAVYVDDAGRIFAAIGSGSNWNDTSRIIASLDDGTSWITIAARVPGYVSSFVETNTGLLFASLRQDGGFGTYGGLLYRSLDGGMSWDSVLAEVPLRLIEARDGSIIASSHEYTDYGPGEYLLHRSTDRGTTWSDVTPAYLWGYEWGIGHDFAIDALGRIYTCGGEWVFRSDDNGATWSQFPVYDPMSRYGGDIVAVALDGLGRIYAGTHHEGIFRSTDDCVSWSSWNSGFDGKYVSDMTTTAKGTVILGSRSSGFYRASMPSRDEGDRSTQPSFRIALDEPTPNPTSDGAMITIDIPVDCNISVGLWNVTGEDVGTILEGYRRAGTYRARVDTRGLADGVYFVVSSALGNRDVRTLFLCR